MPMLLIFGFSMSPPILHPDRLLGSAAQTQVYLASRQFSREVYDLLLQERCCRLGPASCQVFAT